MQIIRYTEGSGDNLSPEDRAEGYESYIYYEQYALNEGIEEIDGGTVMLYLSYNEVDNPIELVLESAYGAADVEYLVLRNR